MQPSAWRLTGCPHLSRGASGRRQRLGQLRCAVCVQGEDVQPAASSVPGHREQDPGGRTQPGHRVLGEPTAAAEGLHGSGQVRAESGGSADPAVGRAGEAQTQLVEGMGESVLPFVRWLISKRGTGLDTQSLLQW